LAMKPRRCVIRPARRDDLIECSDFLTFQAFFVVFGCLEFGLGIGVGWLMRGRRG